MQLPCMRRFSVGLIVAVFGLAPAAAQSSPGAPGNTSSASRKDILKTLQIIHLRHGKQDYPFAVYSNRDLNRGSLSNIKHILLIVHGVHRDAGHYAAIAVRSMSASGGARSSNRELADGLPESGIPEPGATEPGATPQHAGTGLAGDAGARGANRPGSELAGARAADTLVIAPKFINPNERVTQDLPAWRRETWLTGEASVASPTRPPPESSFQVLDDLLVHMTRRSELPALASVVIAGHSAGAQMVQRYAVLSPIAEKLQRAGLDVRFVVANPSSYLYLTGDRPAATVRGFGPYNHGICADYDSYRYGLNHLISYASETDAHTLAARYASRNVTYLLGGADNNPEHRLLDKSCAAEAQGATRLSRGMAYVRYERTLKAAGSWNRHTAFEVTGVGHNAGAMFTSTCGALALSAEIAGTRDEEPGCTRLRATRAP
jgi:hypothetical protein